MSRIDAQLEQLLARLTVEGLDALSPAEVARLEQACEDEAFAARVGALMTPRAEITVPAPSAAAWDAAWNSIERSLARSERADVRAAGWTIRLWQAVTAAAACMLLVISWRAGLGDANPSSRLKLSTNSQIESIENTPTETAYVADLGDDSGSVMIWFLENES